MSPPTKLLALRLFQVDPHSRWVLVAIDCYIAPGYLKVTIIVGY